MPASTTEALNEFVSETDDESEKNKISMKLDPEKEEYVLKLTTKRKENVKLNVELSLNYDRSVLQIMCFCFDYSKESLESRPRTTIPCVKFCKTILRSCPNP